MTTQLVRYDAMCKAIAACHSVDEVKEIRDKALALAKYAEQAKNTDAERKATEIRIRAERRVGELLIDMKESGQRDKGHYRKLESPESSQAPTLADLGISADQSSKWQQLAQVPDHQFESALRDPETRPTTKGILRKAEPDSEPMDTDALWIWGRLRDMERLKLAERDPEEIFEAMTSAMQEDLPRILPSVLSWLRELYEWSTK